MLGGNREAVRKTGVPLSTLGGYIAGGEMKLSNATILARMAGVRLEWLSTGEGPVEVAQPSADPPPRQAMRPGNSPYSGLSEASRVKEDASPLGLTWAVNLDRLARAYEMAQRGIAVLPGRAPDPKRLLQVMLLIYDEMTDAEAASQGPSTPD